MKQRYFMVIINNIEFENEVLTAPKIAYSLLDQGIWLFSSHTAKVKTLEAGDKIVIYAAGRGNRFFLGSFALKTKPEPSECGPAGLERLVKLFALRSEIKEISRWAEPKPMADLLENLSFIKDKRNYGLYLRQGLRVLSEEDYQVIVNE
ncbi:MAG: hypothetical protein GX335_06525 [Firmicutes bacterium]|nr:hypothetical protein [Bacillota bacterium]